MSDRRIRFAVLLALWSVCATAAAHADQADDEADRAEFRQEMASDAKSIGAVIADTDKGKNVSDMRLGMLMMSVLNSLCDRDEGLASYFHAGGRLMETYLISQFQFHSADEVARVAELAEAKPSPIRRAARYALESLRHIPDSGDPPATQVADREQLVAALESLQRNIADAAK